MIKITSEEMIKKQNIDVRDSDLDALIGTLEEHQGFLTALHGSKNVSNVPLSSMLKNRFALSDLESKYINKDADHSRIIEQLLKLVRHSNGFI
jgi:hypothetical protein